MEMVTWVLANEPDEAVQRVIEILEHRLGSDGEAMWVCPGPIAETTSE